MITRAGFIWVWLGAVSVIAGCPTGESTHEEHKEEANAEDICRGSGLIDTHASLSVSTEVPGYFMFKAEMDRSDGKVDRLTLGLRHGGAYEGINGSGTYDVGGSSFDDCSTCLTFWSECEAGSDDCEKVYFATEGEIEVHQWDAVQLDVTINSALMEEVNFNNPIAIRPKSDGDNFCIETEQFTTNTGTGNAPIVTQENCVTEGTGAYLGHNIANFSLTNCLGETFSLHDRCGQSKALWIMSTTGWCTACAAVLGSFANEIGGYIDREKITAAVPGLDMLVVLSENVEGGEPTLEFCMDYATSHDIDPAMVVMDYSPEYVRVDMIAPLGETHGFKAMATTWTHINPYFTEEETGALMSSYPWYAYLRGSNMEYFWSDNIEVSGRTHAKETLLGD
jgi:hypothetical protein